METQISLTLLLVFCISPISVHNLWTSIDLMWEHGFSLKKSGNRWCPTQTIREADYADNIALFANTPTQAESLLYSLEQVAGGIAFDVNANKTSYMCFNKKGDISMLNGGSLKLVDKFTYLRSSVSSTKNDIYIRLAKVWTATDRLSIVWVRPDKIKRSFFQAVVVSILLYGCTTWTLTKRIEKKLNGNYTIYYDLYWTNPGSNIPQNSSYTDTYLLSLKPSKWDEQVMRDTAGK